MGGLGRFAIAGAAFALCAPVQFAAAADPADSGGEDRERQADAAAIPSVGFTMLAGLTLPVCSGQAESCAGGLGAAPSIQGLVLFQPTESWAFGVVGQVGRTHWHGTYVGMVDGATNAVDSDLTNGFVGLAARVVLLPKRVVSPVIQLALASAFQVQTGSNFGCNDGLIPTGQAAVGGRARVSSSVALFALASASRGVKLAGDCLLSDGPPATPFGGWGYGFHAGASFDIALGGAKSGASLAARVR